VHPGPTGAEVGGAGGRPVSRDSAVGAVAFLRLTLGVGSISAPGLTARAFGFPPGQQSAMARLLGRWFGIREIVLATLALLGHGGATPIASRRRPVGRSELEFAAVNAVNDAVDAAAMVVPLVRRDGIDRPQLIGIPVALAVSAVWLRVVRGGPDQRYPSAPPGESP
jgi:stage V sporulation protein SpoVS